MSQKRSPNKPDFMPDYIKKSRIFNKVVSYTVSSFNDGYAFENPDLFKEELHKFLEPVIADQIQAIHDAADMELELLRRDAKIIELRIELAYERSLKKIFQRIDKQIEDFKNNPEERELLAELDALNSMEITEENAAEHNRRMRDALLKARRVLDPSERQHKLKKSLNEAVFGARSTYNDEMIVPLRRMGQSREQREASFQDWIARHYGP